MTEQQRLFLSQARSDFFVFKLLEAHRELPECHALHYLQMATEMFAKARASHQPGPKGSHKAFTGFVQSLATQRRVQQLLGLANQNENWRQWIRKSTEFAERIQMLAPALAGEGPNPEYPWPRQAPEIAPAEYRFDVWLELRDTNAGRKFLRLVEQLLEIAHEFL